MTIFGRNTTNLRVQKNQNIEKIIFKVVQMKFLAMHITNQKFSFDIFMVVNLENIFMEHVLYLISYPYNVFLAIATNIGYPSDLTLVCAPGSHNFIQQIQDMEMILSKCSDVTPIFRGSAHLIPA